MAKYTIAIMDKLQEAAGDNDLTDPTVLLPVARNTLFGQELNVIKSQYQDNFVLAFATHFFNEEIGLETWPLWRMALMSKMYSNADFINQTFDELENQVFSEYKIHKLNSDKTGDNKLNITTGNTVNVSNTHNDTENKTHEHVGNTNVNDTVTRDLSGTSKSNIDDIQNRNSNNTHNGENITDGKIKGSNDDWIHTDNSGDVTTHDSIDVTKTNKGHDITTNSGTDTVSNEGNEKNEALTSTGSESNNKTTIDNTTDDTGTQKFVIKTEVTEKPDITETNNSEQKYSDTPQNGLLDVKKGNYLTSLTLQDTKNHKSGTNLTKTEEHNDRTDDLKHHTKGTNEEHSIVEGGEYSESKSHNDITQTTEHGLKSDKELDITDTEKANNWSVQSLDTHVDTHNSGSQVTNNNTTVTTTDTDVINDVLTKKGIQNTDTTDKGTITDINSKKISENNNEDINKNGGYNTDTVESGNKNAVGNETEHNDLDEKNYTWNYEMFMKSETILNRVWAIFDDIFFLMV